MISQTVAQHLHVQAVCLSLTVVICSHRHSAVLRVKGSVLQFTLADAPQAWSSQVDWDSVLGLWHLY